MSLSLKNCTEEELLEQKKLLVNQLLPSKRKDSHHPCYETFRKNRLLEILKIEEALAKLRDYCSKFDH